MEHQHHNRPPISFEGEQVALGPLRRDLIPTYHRWHNDVAASRTYDLPLPTTLEQEEAAFGELSTARNMTFFTIYDRASWQAIGATYLTDIDHRHRRAEFGILIGEESCRDRGFGAEAATLMLDFAFTVLGLHNVMLTVYEFNLAGRRAYEKAGLR